MSVGHTGVTTLEGPCGHEYEQDCGIREVLDRIGDKWSVLVVVELVAGVRRSLHIQVRGLADWAAAHRDAVAESRRRFDGEHRVVYRRRRPLGRTGHPRSM
jgi:DNA-binding HxlR family transcriptional regulator